LIAENILDHEKGLWAVKIHLVTIFNDFESLEKDTVARMTDSDRERSLKERTIRKPTD